MKKSTKSVILIATILILAGGVFCGAAYAFGEGYMSSKIESLSESFEAASVNKFEINEHVANINITETNNDSGNIIIEAENVIPEHFKCEVTNNVLKISYNPSVLKFGFISVPSFIFDPTAWNRKTPVINIYIPGGKMFDEINFKGGVGNINAEKLNAEVFIIGGGVGNYDINNLSTESLRIDGGVGETTISGIINGEAKIGGGVGNTRLSGQVYGDITVNGGVGNINLDLSGDVSDYNINADSGIGNVRINGAKASEYRNSSGKYSIDLDGGVGNINIDIK